MTVMGQIIQIKSIVIVLLSLLSRKTIKLQNVV